MKNFKRSFPCPVCGGHDGLPRGEGKRCHGFMSSDGRYAHCSREESGGALSPDPKSGKFVHFLDGACKCAAAHVTATVSLTSSFSKASTSKLIHETSWTLKDAAGNVIATHFRKDHADGTKRMWWNKGAKPKKLLYRLHEMLAVDQSRRVILAEGEHWDS